MKSDIVYHVFRIFQNRCPAHPHTHQYILPSIPTKKHPKTLPSSQQPNPYNTQPSLLKTFFLLSSSYFFFFFLLFSFFFFFFLQKLRSLANTPKKFPIYPSYEGVTHLNVALHLRVAHILIQLCADIIKSPPFSHTCRWVPWTSQQRFYRISTQHY